ncbi:C-type mannose receptor 2-like isoform X2 [Centroberyx affinis]|uniref:C-type mannose receptor 2-like isoform X2 n=1 Tax=Centroberyx affinis TaxID=166261 RepID=UPI003A5C5E33
MKGTQILCLLFFSGFSSFTSGSSDFHFVNVAENYTDAKSYCRDKYTDLATVHNAADMDNLIASVPSNIHRAWIGMEIGDVWRWHWSSPDKGLDFFNWKAGEPQNSNQDICAAMNPGGEWFVSDCDTRQSFVCDGSNDTGHIFIAEGKSWREAQNHCRNILSSDLVSIQSAEENEAVQKVSQSQTVWIGLFKDRWKWSDGSNSSFRYWKPNQPNYFRGNQDCVAAVFRDKGQWNDLRCDIKRKFVCHENLILIRENMTWNEAMSYCREHHVDLVYITANEIHEWVAEKAKNATSSHVWLGLRFSCSFDFWFWIKSYAGCYQNWAPGQGPEGQYGCGITGAIEATGGQQWVGLPETEKLNFICYMCAETGEEAQ